MFYFLPYSLSLCPLPRSASIPLSISPASPSNAGLRVHKLAVGHVFCEKAMIHHSVYQIV